MKQNLKTENNYGKAVPDSFRNGFFSKFDILSAFLTVLFLFFIGVLFFFGAIVALNGVSESKGFTALALTFFGQVGILLLAGTFAGWASKALMAKFNWNRAPTIAVVVFAAIFLGAILFFLTIILSILLAGIK